MVFKLLSEHTMGATQQVIQGSDSCVSDSEGDGLM